MARDWSREPYRKLLRNPSPSFRMLDALTQGIGYVLTREADDDGFLPFAATFDDGLAKLWRLFTVPPRRRPIVAQCIRDLLEDGMVAHVGDRLFVKNLRDINERRDYGNKTNKSPPGTTATQRRADGEPTASRVDTAATQRRADGEPRRHDVEPTTCEPPKRTQVPENTKGDPPSRARLQVGREVGREGGSSARAPAPPPRPRLAKSRDAVEAMASELRRRVDLYGDADLEAIADECVTTLEGERGADGIDRRQVAREIVADSIAYAAKYKHADAEQRVAQVAKKLAWIMREISLGRWKPAAQDSTGGDDDDQWENLPSRRSAANV